MKMLPIAVPVLTPSSRGRAGAQPVGDTLPSAPRDAAEPDWQNAYQRRRDEDDQPADPACPSPPLLGLLPTPAPLPRDATAEVAAVRTAASTPTTERLEAVRQLAADASAAAAPVARSWQVELPSTGAPWQLRVEQAQPLAPLALELRVPPVAQSQARQQLGDLDKRLREAGHDVLRPRVRDARGSRRARPVDEVDAS